MPLTGVLAAVPSEVDRERQGFVETVEEILPERDELIGEFNRLVETWNDHWGWFHRNLWNREEHSEEQDVLERIRRDLEETPFPEETGGGRSSTWRTGSSTTTPRWCHSSSPA